MKATGSDTRPLLVLVDGSSYLFRAFHALPPLTTSAGEPTGAIHGVMNMLLKLLREYTPQHVAVVFDASGKTFRDEIYSEYKAQRPPMPDELRTQLQPLKDIVVAMGLPLVSIAGVEADDVIGTLACQAAKKGMRTIVSTIDKDMAQLVDDRITLVDTMFDRVLDPDAVVAKFGVEPGQIIDYLALVGDTSDNIPGVPGVGPKTASALLQHYGSIDAIYADLDGVAEVKIRGAGKLGAKLDKHREDVMLSRRLATIVTDVELDIAPDDLAQGEGDEDALRELYRRLELKRLLQQLSGPTQSTSAAPPRTPSRPAAPRDYETITSMQALDALVATAREAPLVALDIERTDAGYMQAEIVGIALSTSPGSAAYVPLRHDYAGAPAQLDRSEALEKLRPLLEDEALAKLGHDLKTDAHVLSNHGVRLAGMRFDSMLESYVLNSTATRHDLDSIALRYLEHETIRYEQVAGKGVKQLAFAEVPLEQGAEYAAENADVTLQLHKKIWPRLRATPSLRKLYTEVEQPLVEVLQRMEQAGVLIDTERLARLSAEFRERMATIEDQAYAEAGAPFNLESPKQLREVLFERLGLPVLRKTRTRMPSTAEDVLVELAADYALPQLILDYRSLSKLRSTYLESLPGQVDERTGRVHTSYRQAVAATGRLSSTDPNLQNIPIRHEEGRRIRRAFVAAPGHVLLAADYSQIELRIMAHLSGDEGLLVAFAEDRDIHQATAAEVFGTPLDEVDPDQRRAAKAINFGLIYGMSAFGLARQLGIERRAAQEYVDLYFERYPGVRRYMESTRATAREQGYVETVYGRRLYLNDIASRNAPRRQAAERAAINAPMQGTAADIIKRAMIALDDWLRREAREAKLIMQVHDELVLEVPEAEAEQLRDNVIRIMAAAAELAVELRVDAGLGHNWDEAH